MQTRVPSLLGWARPVFEQGALPALSILPADHLLCVLPGSMLFQSEVLDKGYMRPPIFHAYSGDKLKWGECPRNLAAQGIVPLLASLLGMDDFHPLWQHGNGCDFVVGNKWKSSYQQGRMTQSQVTAIMKGRPRFDLPELPMFATSGYTIAQSDWYALDDSHIPPDLVKCVLEEMKQQPGRVHEASAEARREVGKACFQRLLATTSWQRKTEQSAFKIWCTGLGGGDPLDNTYDAVLACVLRSPTYGATLAMQDWGLKRTTIGRTVAVHEFFMFTMSCAYGPRLWQMVPGVPVSTVDKIPTRAKEILERTALLPAHRREAHPSWTAATRLLLAMCHPASVGLLWHWFVGGQIPQNVRRELTIHGFSAGSLNGLVLHLVASRFFPAFQGATVLGALACDPLYLRAPTTVGLRSLRIVHYEGDSLCIWRPSPAARQVLADRNIGLTWIEHMSEDKQEVDWLGPGHHNYGHLTAMELPPGTVT